MCQQKLCICVASGLDLPSDECPLAFKRAGFDGFFFLYEDRESALRYAELAKKEGIVLQSVHAPFHGVDSVWKEGERGDEFIARLLECVDTTADCGAPIMVCHAWIGFDTPDKPNALGLKRFEKLVAHASARGIRIAFENTEGDEFLAAVMDHFKGNPAVGFCWDIGHELCYNRGVDQLALYGDRLLMTHINDNLGISDFDGHIYWTDDLHLLPFDGIVDWQGVVERLNKVGFNGPLSFELSRASKLNRHDNDKYVALPVEQYLAEAYARACRLGAMKLKG